MTMLIQNNSVKTIVLYWTYWMLTVYRINGIPTTPPDYQGDDYEYPDDYDYDEESEREPLAMSTVYEKVGQSVTIDCNARIAGAEPTIKGGTTVVWALSLRRLSASGCNPMEPVMTLAELKHVSSDMENEQIYNTIPVEDGRYIHIDGARLKNGLTNFDSALISLTITSTNLEDNGVYRCDAMVGQKDDHFPMELMTSYLRLYVYQPKLSIPNFDHVSTTDAPVSLDYDSSMVAPFKNHIQVGETAEVTCATRLLMGFKSLSIPVMRLRMTYLPFWVPHEDFTIVAEYIPHANAFLFTQPDTKKWEFSHVGAREKGGPSITIRIRNATVQDSGIFRCVAKKATTNEDYIALAGVKVSNEKGLVAGYCDPEIPGLVRQTNATRLIEDQRNDDSDFKDHMTIALSTPLLCKISYPIIAVAAATIIVTLVHVFCWPSKDARKERVLSSEEKKKKERKRKRREQMQREGEENEDEEDEEEEDYTEQESEIDDLSLFKDTDAFAIYDNY